MTHESYGLFCPLALAAERIGPRWTMLILAELTVASRFNDIRRGVPGISPTLLSKRLKEMEENGLVERIEDRSAGTVDYLMTDAGRDLYPALQALGEWAHRHIELAVTYEHLNARVLMWNVRRKIDFSGLRDRRTVVRFHFHDAPKGERLLWLVWKPGQVTEICLTDPGFDVDLFIEAELRAFTQYWMGHTTIEAEILAGRIELHGSQLLARTLSRWMVQSAYALAAQ